MKLIRETILINTKKSEEELWKQLNKKIRNDIRKAKKTGVTIHTTSDQKTLKRCNQLFIETNRRHLTPVLKSHKFDITDKLLLIAKYKRRTVGFVLLRPDHVAPNSMIFMWAATDYKYRSLQATSLLYWEAILETKRRGHEYCNLGVSDHGAADRQMIRLKKFKERWNGLHIPIIYNIGIIEWLWLRVLRRFTVMKKLKYFIWTNFYPKYWRY